MSWIIYAAGAVALTGLALMGWDTYRMRARRTKELAQLASPVGSEFQRAERKARNLHELTGIPHHAKLTNGRWIVVAMEEGE